MSGKASVVICTRNRAYMLDRLLSYWSEVESSALEELIFVDNGSMDNTWSKLEIFQRSSLLTVKLAYEQLSGLSRARNCGLRLVQGEFVIFSDDDCYPEYGYVRNVVEIFENRPDIGFLGGRVLLYDSRDLPITIKNSTVRVEIPECSLIKPGVIHGANFAIRKSVCSKVGFFDNLFGAGGKLESAEDTEYMAKASWAGYKGMFTPEPVVYHHHGRRSRKEARRLTRGYSIGRGAYFTKYIIKRSTRNIYLKYWLSEFCREFDRQRLLEVKGALLYLWYDYFRSTSR